MTKKVRCTRKICLKHFRTSDRLIVSVDSAAGKKKKGANGDSKVGKKRKRAQRKQETSVPSQRITDMFLNPKQSATEGKTPVSSTYDDCITALLTRIIIVQEVEDRYFKAR